MKSAFVTATLIILTLSAVHAQDLRTALPAKDYYRSGQKHFGAKEYGLALADFNKVLEIDPRHADALYSRILTLSQLYPDKEAVADWDRLIDIAPRYPHISFIYSIRANYRARISQYDASIDDCNKLLEIKPHDLSGYWIRSFDYMMKGKMSLALADYQAGAKLQSDFQTPFVARAHVYILKRSFQLAIDDYTRSLEWKPDDGIVYFDRGVVYILMGDITKGLADIRKGFKLDPTAAGERPLDGYRCPFCALNLYVKRFPNDARVYEARGVLRLLQRREGEAKSEFDQAIHLLPALKAEIEEVVKQLMSDKL